MLVRGGRKLELSIHTGNGDLSAGAAEQAIEDTAEETALGVADSVAAREGLVVAALLGSSTDSQRVAGSGVNTSLGGGEGNGGHEGEGGDLGEHLD